MPSAQKRRLLLLAGIVGLLLTCGGSGRSPWPTR